MALEILPQIDRRAHQATMAPSAQAHTLTGWPPQPGTCVQRRGRPLGISTTSEEEAI